MENMKLGPKTKERRFRYFGNVLRESSGKELEELVTKEITQKTRVRGRKRKKWHEIGKMGTGITSIQTYRRKHRTGKMERTFERCQPSLMKRCKEEEEMYTYLG